MALGAGDGSAIVGEGLKGSNEVASDLIRGTELDLMTANDELSGAYLCCCWPWRLLWLGFCNAPDFHRGNAGKMRDKYKEFKKKSDRIIVNH